MSTDSGSLSRDLIPLLWRHWTALGVTGWTDEEPRPVDPEALIVLTARVGDIDVRLRDCAVDWCIAFGDDFVNETRLLHVVREIGGDDPRVSRFFATVAANGGPIWSKLGDVEAQSGYENRHKVYLPNLESAGRLVLRLRATLGVTVRADILAALAGPNETVPIVAIERRTRYSRKAIDNAIKSLMLAGVLIVTSVSPRDTRVSLRENSPFTDWLSGVPAMPDWVSRFHVFLRVLTLSDSLIGLASSVAGVQARSVFGELGPAIVQSGLLPPADMTGSAYMEGVNEWVSRLPHALSA